MTTIQGIDDCVLNFIQNHLHFPILDKIMIFASTIGNNGAIWIVIALFLMATKKYRPIGLMITIALFFCLLIGSFTLKPYFARMRPFHVFTNVILLIKGPTDFSFPSGHTMTSFASATVLLLKNKHWGLLAIGLASLIAFSRMYLFVHYPSDIIVGLLIGIIIAICIVKMEMVIDKKSLSYLGSVSIRNKDKNKDSL